MKRLFSRRTVKATALPLGIIALLLIGFGFGVSAVTLERRFPLPPMPFDSVLDGDTIVAGGNAIHIGDLDAPELGPWAHCWAEAALAGLAKSELETILLQDRGWHLVSVRRDKSRHLSGRVIDRDGNSIADDMRVYGGSATTSGRWNWCDVDPKMRSPLEGERPPIGPNLYWPEEEKMDPRAGD
ncbi:MAG TPA: hypothetical protein VF637_10260 [Sphingomicrobium sp.]|jgi:endonuclease YncB( thermonuclease family)